MSFDAVAEKTEGFQSPEGQLISHLTFTQGICSFSAPTGGVEGTTSSPFFFCLCLYARSPKCI